MRGCPVIRRHSRPAASVPALSVATSPRSRTSPPRSASILLCRSSRTTARISSALACSLLCPGCDDR
eukprot:scaffold12640_cov106-Isochrysis_galbana.AAC.16